MKTTAKLSFMMFVEWFIWGAWFVPLWLWLSKSGFSAGEIGWSYACTAIAAILSELNRQGRITVVENFDVDAAKTKVLADKLAGLNAGKRPLIVTEDASEALYLSARNLPYVQVRDVQGLDPVALVGADTVVITADAVKKVEEWLA